MEMGRCIVNNKTLTAKPRVPLQVFVTERHRDILLAEARKEGLSLSECVRRLIEEAIRTYIDAKQPLN